MKYRMVIEYEAPPVGQHSFSNTSAEMHVEQALTEYLDSCEDLRVEALRNIYKIKAQSTVMELPYR